MTPLFILLIIFEANVCSTLVPAAKSLFVPPPPGGTALPFFLFSRITSELLHCSVGEIGGLASRNLSTLISSFYLYLHQQILHRVIAN